MAIIARNFITVYQDGNRFGWAIRRNGCGTVSTQTFATELAAAQAAASVAGIKRLPLRVSATMQRLLTATWYTDGWQKAAAGKPRDLCRNQHERRGYDEAQAHSYMLVQVGTGALVEVEVA